MGAWVCELAEVSPSPQHHSINISNEEVSVIVGSARILHGVVESVRDRGAGCTGENTR